jgi:hypothetical protein
MISGGLVALELRRPSSRNEASKDIGTRFLMFSHRRLTALSTLCRNSFGEI